jgi:tetratricopeptide (TPR) repeat protein
MGIKNIKIFIASSKELKEERAILQNLFSGLNDDYIKKGLYLKVVIWEKLKAGFSKGRKQEEFNQALLDSDIGLFLIFTKFGEYTKEEFYRALESFKKGGKPEELFVYFKNAQFDLGSLTDDFQDVLKLKKEIEKEQQFYCSYKSIEDLENQVTKQIELILEKHLETKEPNSSGENPLNENKDTNFRSSYILPRYNAEFVNREDVIDEAISYLKVGKIVQLIGLGGIGKTELALKIAYSTKEYFTDGIIWHFSAKSSLEDIVNALARNYKVDLQLPLQDKKMVLYDLLSGKNRLLLCFDNVELENSQAIQDIIDIAKDSPILITNRPYVKLKFHGAELVYLHELNGKDSINLLYKRIGKKLSLTDEIEAEKIINQTGGYPLALELIASWIKYDNIAINKMPYLLKRSLEGKLDDDKHIYSVFNEIFNNLKEEQKKIFSFFGIVEETVDLIAIKSICQIDESEFYINQLIKLSLIKESQERYFVHPLLKSFAEGKITDNSMYVSMIKYYLQYTNSNALNFEMLDIERTNILSSIEHAYNKELFEEALQFIFTLMGKNAYYGYFAQKGYWTEGIKKMELALEISSKSNNLFHQSVLNQNLGLFHYWLGNNESSRKYLEQALKILTELNDIKGIISTYHNLGYIEDDENYYDKARYYYEESLRLSKQIDDQSLIALSYHLVGVIDYHQGLLGSARENANRAIEINSKIDDKSAVLRNKRRLAAIARTQAHYANADEKQNYLNEAKNLLDESLINETNKRSLARAERQMGMLFEEKNELDKAEQCYTKSLEMFKSIGNKKGFGTIYFNLGSIEEKKENFDQAIEYYNKSKEIAKDLKCKYGIACALRQLGKIEYNKENGTKFLEYYKESLKIFTEINSFYKKEVSQLLSQV